MFSSLRKTQLCFNPSSSPQLFQSVLHCFVCVFQSNTDTIWSWHESMWLHLLTKLYMTPCQHLCFRAGWNSTCGTRNPFYPTTQTRVASDMKPPARPDSAALVLLMQQCNPESSIWHSIFEHIQCNLLSLASSWTERRTQQRSHMAWHSSSVLEELSGLLVGNGLRVYKKSEFLLVGNTKLAQIKSSSYKHVQPGCGCCSACRCLPL